MLSHHVPVDRCLPREIVAALLDEKRRVLLASAGAHGDHP
jgi:hypothetical protein